MQIIHLISNKSWGGGERYAFDLCNQLDRDGSEVTAVVRRSAEGVAAKFREGKFRVVEMRLGGPFDIITPIKLSKLLEEALTREPQVVVHVHNFKDAATALKARSLVKAPGHIKIICTRHLVSPAKTDATHRELYKQLDAIIFVSELARIEFLSSQPDVDPARLHVVHNGTLPHPALTSEKEVKAIFAGRITPEKGLDTLIRAMARMRHGEMRLTVCGTGRGRDVMPLVRLARAEGVDGRIDWLGHVENVAEMAAGCSIGVVPSTWREPFGLVIIEFMQQGLAVVTTNNGAQPEIITDGVDGVMVSPEDPQALADALDMLLDSPTLVAELGANARKTVAEKFGFDRFYRQILEIYRR